MCTFPEALNGDSYRRRSLERNASGVGVDREGLYSVPPQRTVGHASDGSCGVLVEPMQVSYLLQQIHRLGILRVSIRQKALCRRMGCSIFLLALLQHYCQAFLAHRAEMPEKLTVKTRQQSLFF